MAARSISGTLKCLPTPMVDSPVLAEASTSPAPTHVLADLGGLLFLSRASRPDLAYAVGFFGPLQSRLVEGDGLEVTSCVSVLASHTGAFTGMAHPTGHATDD